MKKYITGFLSCVLIVCGLIFFTRPVYAQQPSIPLAPNSYIWIKKDISLNDTNIKKVTSGGIVVGYMDDARHTPIVEQGVIIEFAASPTSEDLKKLDISMSAKGLQREGGATLSDKIAELETKIKALEVIAK